MDAPVLEDLVTLSVVAVAVVGGLTRVRVPTILGLILAGTVAGPHGLGLVHRPDSLDALSEVGLVLLLFTVGLEFSLGRLRRIATVVVLGGILQVGLTAMAVALTGHLYGLPWSKGIFLGFVFAMSSTAIVLKSLTDRGETDAPHGRFIVGVLVFQDLAVVFVMLLATALAGESGDGAVAAGLALGRAALIVAATVFLSRLVIPRLFRLVTVRRSRELFLLAVTSVLAATTWVATATGLSPSLGAFLAGLMLADTEFRHRALGDMIPFRDLLTSLFFLSLGMMADVRVLIEAPVVVLGLAVAIVLGKGLIAALSAMVMRFPARVAWLAGAGLAQFSEFGFILLGVGVAGGLVTPEEQRIFMISGALSMMVTPLVLWVAPHTSAGEAILAPLERLLAARSMDELAPSAASFSDHVVVVGYGVAGQVLAQALEKAGVQFVVLELNAETVRKAAAAGKPVFYADATSREALHHAQLGRARAMVILINDPEAVHRIVVTARQCTREVPILVRTRYLADRAQLLGLGATEVVVEEVEAGLEVLAKVLSLIGVPQAQTHVQQAREATGVQGT